MLWLFCTSEQMPSGSTKTGFNQGVDPHDCSAGFGWKNEQNLTLFAHILQKSCHCGVLDVRWSENSREQIPTDPRGCCEGLPHGEGAGGAQLWQEVLWVPGALL